MLFVQLIPKLLKTDMAAERAKFEAASNVGEEEFKKTKKEELFYADSMGFFPFSLAIILGIVLAKIQIPLPGGAVFSLGTSGGSLIAGLILGRRCFSTSSSKLRTSRKIVNWTERRN